MNIAKTFASMSHSNRAKVGAIIVKDDNILSYGWNGTPHGYDNVCEINDVTIPEVIHAECNALMKLAKSTNSSLGSTLYVTLSPCIECAKMIKQAGIVKVYYNEPYRDSSGLEMLSKLGIETQKINYE